MTHELISSHLKLYDSFVWGKDSNEYRKKVHERTFWIFSMNHLIRFIKPMILLNWTDLVLQFNSLIRSFTAVSNKTLLVENNCILNLFLTQSYRSCLWTTLIVLLCLFLLANFIVTAWKPHQVFRMLSVELHEFGTIRVWGNNDHFDFWMNYLQRKHYCTKVWLDLKHTARFANAEVIFLARCLLAFDLLMAGIMPLT